DGLAEVRAIVELPRHLILPQGKAQGGFHSRRGSTLDTIRANFTAIVGECEPATPINHCSVILCPIHIETALFRSVRRSHSRIPAVERSIHAPNDEAWTTFWNLASPQVGNFG